MRWRDGAREGGPLEEHSLVVYVEPDQECVRVTPEGQLDGLTLPRLAEAVADLRAVGITAFRLDLRRLTSIDSLGLQYLNELTGAGT